MRMPFDMPEPPPEAREAIEKVHKAEFEVQMAWRRTVTGPWAMLFCACRLPEEGPRGSLLQFKPYEPVSSGCPVHGTFIMTHDGEVL